ncbi:MAG: KAP family NTPase [Bacilli bacterium]|nr:KAP family NTPase [Bacilli bacterium]
MKNVKSDLLDRTGDIQTILKLIGNGTKNGENISFAIDGKWGVGKTHLVKLISEAAKNDYLCFYYDAWDNDFYDEPVIGILDSLIDQLNELGHYEVNANIKEILSDIAGTIKKFLDEFCYRKIGFKPIDKTQKLFGKVRQYVNIEKISNTFNPNKEVKEAKELLCNSLRDISKQKPIILFFDELDRCEPEYAMKILERMHHINERVPSTATIVCVDSFQLTRVIEKYYGNDKSGLASNFLRKIIDFTYVLDNGKINENISILLDEFSQRFDDPTLGISKKSIYDFINNMFSDFSMRNRIKIIKDTEYIDSLIYSKEERRPLDMMCGELMICWAISYYGTNFNTLFYNDLIGYGDKNNSFLQYLKQNDQNLVNRYYDKFFESTIINIQDIKTLMIYMFLREYKTRYKLINIRILPNYINDLMAKFSPLLLKIRY